MQGSAHRNNGGADRRAQIVVICLVVLSLGCVKISTGEGEVSARSPEAADHLAMTDWNGKPVIPITIGGQGPYTFIVDTGAGVTVIDVELRDALALAATGQTEIGSPMGTPTTTDVFLLPEVSVGNTRVTEVRAVSLDLAALFGDGGPRGVLSTQAFPGHTLTLNFARHWLEIRPGTLPPADGQEIFDFPAADGMASVPVSLGDIELRVHLDTGAPSSLNLPLRLAESLPLVAAPVVVGQAATVDASVDVLGATLDGDLTIGKHRFERPRIEFIEHEKTGHMGMELLRHFAVTLDHSSGRVRFERVDAAESVEGARKVAFGGGGKKRYGIRFSGIDGPELRVIGVDPGSPAAIGGVLDGDVIVAMNGTSTADMDRGARISALKGSPLVVTVQREGEQQELTLSLD